MEPYILTWLKSQMLCYVPQKAEGRENLRLRRQKSLFQENTESQWDSKSGF